MENTTLQALQLIESVEDLQSGRIVPVSQCTGTVVSADELMAAKIQWAERAGYSVLTTSVPEGFAPYNAIIRVSERGTEDQQRDYLAKIAY
ncbi:MAG: hypothetical protein NVS2B16_28960 [Chloroflexota bacterium]